MSPRCGAAREHERRPTRCGSSPCSERSLTRVSGSLVDGVSVADLLGSKPTAMAARILTSLGATVGSTADADVVIAGHLRRTGDSTGSVWVCVTPFGATGPRSSWRASDLGVMAASGNLYC